MSASGRSGDTLLTHVCGVALPGTLLRYHALVRKIRAYEDTWVMRVLSTLICRVYVCDLSKVSVCCAMSHDDYGSGPRCLSTALLHNCCVR